MNTRQLPDTNLAEIPLLNNQNYISKSVSSSKQQLKELEKLLTDIFENIPELIEPFTTLKLYQPNKTENIFNFNLGYEIQLIDFADINFKSFGLEKIFVFPASNQIALPYFGTFQIFFYMISCFITENTNLDAELNQFMMEFKQQNNHLETYFNLIGLQRFRQFEEDQKNLIKFISNLRQVFENNYIEVLREIFNVIVAILKLKQLSEFQEKNSFQDSFNQLTIIFSQKINEITLQKNPKFFQVFENSTTDTEDKHQIDIDFGEIQGKDQNQKKNESFDINEREKQLQDLFQNLLKIKLQEQEILQINLLLKNYSSNPKDYNLNSNRILGFAQFLYQNLVISFLSQIGQVLSKKLQKQNQSFEKQSKVTFFRFPDQQLGGTIAKPYLPNWYFVNFFRDLIISWFQNQKQENQDEKQQIENLMIVAKGLSKLNDHGSIKDYFKQAQSQSQNDPRFIVKIFHKLQCNNQSIYQFDEFISVHKSDISEKDKNIIMSSKLQLFKNYQEQLPIKNPFLINDLISTFEKIKKNENRIYLFRIEDNNLVGSIKEFIKDFKILECSEKKKIKRQISLYDSDSLIFSSDDSITENRQTKI